MSVFRFVVRVITSGEEEEQRFLRDLSVEALRWILWRDEREWLRICESGTGDLPRATALVLLEPSPSLVSGTF